MQYLYAFLKKAEFLSFYFDEKDEQLQQKLPQFLHVHLTKDGALRAPSLLDDRSYLQSILNPEH
jgi:hypothetical protein